MKNKNNYNKEELEKFLPDYNTINKYKTYDTNDDDEARVNLYLWFNRWLTQIARKYELDFYDSNKIVQMFFRGASPQQMEEFAKQIYESRRQANAEACQRIADEKAGGHGTYHGYIGINNPGREDEER